MTVRLISALIVLSIAHPVWAQEATQGSYLRKSVSSLETLWVRPGAIPEGVLFDFDLFTRMLQFYIEVPRFDFNNLPESVTEEFRTRANEIQSTTPEEIARVIEATVVPAIMQILNDPEVVEARRSGLVTEADQQRFAATKAKSLGLTTDQLVLLFNTAYIYLPFISEVHQERPASFAGPGRAGAASLAQRLLGQVVSFPDPAGTAEEGDGETAEQESPEEADSVGVTITGGILWYQVQVDAQTGSSSLVAVQTAESTTIGYADFTNDIYRSFFFDGSTIATTPEQNAQYTATRALAKNLGTKTKEIPDFKLSAQVIESVGRRYGFPLGKREGIHLDDGFFLVESVMDASGEIVPDRVGYVRVVQTGDNREDESQLTYAVQMKGLRRPIGTVVMENPTSGIDLRLRPHYVLGFGLPASATEFTGTGQAALSADATTAIGGSAVLAYNVAPIIGISQLFLNTDLSTSVIQATTSTDSSGIPIWAAAYLTVTKKLWLGPLNAQVSIGSGIDWLDMRGSVEGTTFQWTWSKIGVKGGIDAEYLIAPNLSAHIGAAYSIGLYELKSTVQVGEGDPSDYDTSIDELRLGGLIVRAGISRTVRELPFDIFGFLDPLKRF